MFWTIIIFCILSFAFFKLGVFTILVTVLAVSLKVAIGCIYSFDSIR